MTLDEPTKDRLRELGAEADMLLWLEHPEHVRYLLTNLWDLDEDSACIGCGQRTTYGCVAHLRDCKVLNAQLALGLSRLEDEVERAEREARTMATQRRTALTLGRIST